MLKFNIWALRILLALIALVLAYRFFWVIGVGIPAQKVLGWATIRKFI